MGSMCDPLAADPRALLGRALTGEGASLRGGRWNSRGLKAVYTSLDAATTVLETLTTFDPALAPVRGYELIRIRVPDEAPVMEVSVKALPKHWNDWSTPSAARTVGDPFLLAGEFLLLIVPSVVLPQARNAILNPAYPMAAHLTILERSPFEFDPR